MVWQVESLFIASLHISDFVQTENEAKILTSCKQVLTLLSIWILGFSSKWRAAYFDLLFDGQTNSDWREILRVDGGLQGKHFIFLVWFILSSVWLSSSQVKVSIYKAKISLNYFLRSHLCYWFFFLFMITLMILLRSFILSSLLLTSTQKCSRNMVIFFFDSFLFN